jgi:hypothetical protein
MRAARRGAQNRRPDQGSRLEEVVYGAELDEMTPRQAEERVGERGTGNPAD